MLNLDIEVSIHIKDAREVKISMGGKDQVLDNIYTERLWTLSKV